MSSLVLLVMQMQSPYWSIYGPNTDTNFALKCYCGGCFKALNCFNGDHFRFLQSSTDTSIPITILIPIPFLIFISYRYRYQFQFEFLFLTDTNMKSNFYFIPIPIPGIWYRYRYIGCYQVQHYVYQRISTKSKEIWG